MATYERSAEHKEHKMESRDSSPELLNKFKQKHEKIRRHMENLAKRYNIQDFPEKLREEYNKLKGNTRFSKMHEYLNLIDAWVKTFQSSNFSLDKLDKFQTDICLLVLALKENLEDNNERVEEWLEIMANKESISQTADRADEAVLARSAQEQEELFNEIRQNRKPQTAAA